MNLIRALLAVLALAWGAEAMAEDRSALWPDIPAATGDPHPEGNAYWRKNHMTLMQHDRDLTLRMGDREIQASLKACFSCHTATDAAGQVLTYADEGHFCRSCHDFAAVRVDCFMCHRSTPDGVDEGAAHARAAGPRPPLAAGQAGSITAYLNKVARKEVGQ